MVSSFNHTGLVVQDIDKMVAFYTQTLGLKKLREIDSVAPPTGDHTGFPGARRKLVFVGFEGGHQIELVRYFDPPSPQGHLERNQLGASHICFNVKDLAGLHKNLLTKGVRFVTELKWRDAPGGGRIGIVYARDPEGNWLEFIQPA
ncbi:MAG: VOC family protein [Chloroflexi bacterium]|nr:VOC family protein [Chloroflexota bacterium]